MASPILINNLQIVQDDEMWQVITPDGEVLEEFDDKLAAIDFAESVTDYVEENDALVPVEEKPTSRAMVKTDERKRSILPRAKQDSDIGMPIVEGTVASDDRPSRLSRWRSINWTRIFGGLVVLLAASGVTAFIIGAVIPAGINLFEEMAEFVYHDLTIPVLGVLMVGVPFLLMLLRNSKNHLLQSWLQPVVMGIGIVNSGISLVLGAIFLVVSFFSADYDFLRALIVFGLWAFFSWTVVFFAREIDRIQKDDGRG
jgi:hypothetical protein